MGKGTSLLELLRGFEPGAGREVYGGEVLGGGWKSMDKTRTKTGNMGRIMIIMTS